jgi:hypothetical protein
MPAVTYAKGLDRTMNGRPHVIKRHHQRGRDHDQVAAPSPGGRVRKAADERDRGPGHGDDHADAFAPVERFNSKRGADEHGHQGQSRKRERAPRCGGVTKCQIEQHDEEREIHDAERGDGEPIAAARPFDPQRERDRQQQQKSNAKSEHAERDRIARADRKPRGAARHAAQRARRDCREHADILVSQSAHGRSGETA